MRLAALLIATMLATSAFAKLPPLSDENKAKAAEAAARNAWTDKVGQYKLCLAMDRTVEAYRKSAQAAGKAVAAPAAPVPCVDPGPYVSPVAQAPKPLEASGAHSPPEKAGGPPSSKATSAELSPAPKK